MEPQHFGSLEGPRPRFRGRGTESPKILPSHPNRTRAFAESNATAPASAILLSTAPMKCLKGPVPRVVATASGEAAADQEMAHLLLAQELSGISGSDELGRCPPSFFRPLKRAPGAR